MGVGGCMSVIKYLMFAFNLLYWLAGTAILAIALWLRFDKETQGFFKVENSPETLLTGVYILIVAGSLMMVFGFLGCCGAIRESPCMLGLFFAFLLIIFTAEVAAGIWGLSNKNKIVEEVKQFYVQAFNDYKTTPNQVALKETLTAIQYSLHCCGTTGTIADGGGDTCPNQQGLSQVVTQSCPSAIEDLFNSKMQVIGGVGIGLGLVMILGMITSMMLCCAIRRTRDVV